MIPNPYAINEPDIRSFFRRQLRYLALNPKSENRAEKLGRDQGLRKFHSRHLFAMKRFKIQ
jgi:hypothetical protein